ncbi:NAD(P)/FAD-dependent oxidoreductase [Methylophilus sp. 13]|uniref:flavin-containing monooxygenase n=1 Tax=Methylophilus sp. 13 TaxID=2781018 RepID=UPI001890B03C|nr:NAD(P)/FAD-dependent oxidoreductase [Methylophilus sp. 13]MBF5040478.1 NAD(P)/FAD-dependent oxidoreductase [Methylophilus sp. 13]
MNIAIVGAGFAGLSTAKVLTAFGHQVTVFEKEADVGGVWSASRRYPNLTTQNVKSTYAFSDFPYPKHYPEWPSGEQVQHYLDAYTKQFNFAHLISLNTEVKLATPIGQGWQLTVKTEGKAEETRHFDFLIVCNGIFSQPMIPDYPGAAVFTAAGGRICHTSEFKELADAKGKHVLIVGYGKSSTDVAQAVCQQAASTTVVARHLIWKVPKRLMNVLNYKYLFLTRMGEGLFKYIRLKGIERFLHGIGKPIRNSMLNQVQWVINRQCRLEKLGLKPDQPLESIARSTVSLVTEGFFESVEAGHIDVAKQNSITGFSIEHGVRYAHLTDGRRLPADIVICGTGWHQRVPFLNDDVMKHVTDAEGNFVLYRSMAPVGMPGLAFNGYNSSFFSQLNAEVGAYWLADWIGGKMKLPTAEAQRSTIKERLAWMEARTEGKHSKGTNIIPFSLHHIDELLSDMRLPLGVATRFKQWFLPIDPADFQYLHKALLQRHQPHAAQKMPVQTKTV